MKVTEVAAAVIERPDGSFLLGQRAPDTFYAGYWEFPGGKVEPGETAHQALIRELQEELGIRVERADPWLRREHVYEHAHVRLNFFRVRKWSGELRDHVHSALVWQQPGATSVTPMLPANAPVLAALELPDFYAITQAGEIGVEAQMDGLKRALSNGLKLVQIREPGLSAEQRNRFAHEAVALCHASGARVLINGDVELATRCGADGVHLKAHQLNEIATRPDFPLVAASCHTSQELQRAADVGCDFTVFGPVLATATHPDAKILDWDGLANALAVPPAPTFALGGLQRENLDHARRSGAHGIAAIRGAWSE